MSSITMLRPDLKREGEQIRSYACQFSWYGTPNSCPGRMKRKETRGKGKGISEMNKECMR